MKIQHSQFILILIFWSLIISAKGQKLVRLQDINPGSGSSNPSFYGSTGYFSATAGNFTDPGLYFTNGTPENTLLLKKFGTASFNFFANGGHFIDNTVPTLIGNDLLFIYDKALYKSNGTAVGTTLVSSVIQPSGKDGLVHKGILYFNGGKNGAISTLCRSDGTPNGTTSLRNTNLLAKNLFSYGDKFVFSGDDQKGNGIQLWISDGTDNGTSLLKVLRSGASNASPANFITLGKKFLFTAVNEQYKDQYWISDGTAAGTVLLKPGMLCVHEQWIGICPRDGILYFTQNDSQIWRTDGTSQGTYMVFDNKFGWPPYILTDEGLIIADNGSYDSEKNKMIKIVGDQKIDNFGHPDDPDKTFRYALQGYKNGVTYYIRYKRNSSGGDGGPFSWRSDNTVKGTYLVDSLIPTQLISIDSTTYGFVTSAGFATTADSVQAFRLSLQNGKDVLTPVTEKVSDVRFTPAFILNKKIVGTGTNSRQNNKEPWAFDGGVVVPKKDTIITQHFHQITQNPTFKSRKQLGQNKAFKICADGSNASIFKVYSKGRDYSVTKFRVKEYPNNVASDTLLSGKFTTIYRSNDSLVVRYRHPNHISTSTASLTLTLELIDTTKSIPILIKSDTIIVYHAPVAMVHGLWSGFAAFAEMEKELLKSGMYTPIQLKRIDYWGTANREFSYNVPNIIAGIDYLIKSLQEGGIAAGKVDYVAHSMGGILGRLYLQRPTYRQDIHKLITLNTPHSGSQMANFLLGNFKGLTKLLCNDILQGTLDMQGCDGGAVTNLQVNSSAVLNDLNGTANLNRNKVPSHAIVTTEFINPENDIAKINSNLSLTNIKNIIDAIISEDISGGTKLIFNNTENDLIVAAVSQQGGLIGQEWSAFDSQIHMGSPANKKVIEQVKLLLNESPVSNKFSQTGFHPVKLTYNLPSIIPDPGSVIVINEIINIISPKRGEHFNTGTRLNLVANGKGITEIKTIIRYNQDSIYTSKEISSSVNYSALVGSTPGKREMIVIGKTTSGAVITDTSYFFVDNPCLPVTITGKNTFCTGDILSLTAVVSGGTAPYMFQWKQSTTNVGTNSPIFSTSAAGNYSVQVTDSKGCQTTSLPIAVTQQPLPPAPTIISSSSAIAAGGSIQLKTTAISDQSVQWLLNNTAITGATQTTFTAIQEGNYSVKVTNSNGCSATSQAVIISLVTGLEDEPIIDKDFIVSALPNPSPDKIEVQVRTKGGKFVTVTLSLYDLTGRNVYRKNIKVNGLYTEQIDLSNQPSGSYILNAITDNQQTSIRIIKQ